MNVPCSQWGLPRLACGDLSDSVLCASSRNYLFSICFLVIFIEVAFCLSSYSFYIWKLLVCTNAQSCQALLLYGLQPPRILCPRRSPGKNTGVGCHFLLQGIFPLKRSNLSVLCFLHCQSDSLPLSHLGSPCENWHSLSTPVKVTQSCPTLCDPMDYTVYRILQARILQCVAILFSSGSSQPRDRIQVSRIAGRFFTSWTTKEAQEYWHEYPISFPVDLPNPGINLGSPVVQADSLPTELPGKP